MKRRSWANLRGRMCSPSSEQWSNLNSKRALIMRAMLMIIIRTMMTMMLPTTIMLKTVTMARCSAQHVLDHIESETEEQAMPQTCRIQSTVNLPKHKCEGWERRSKNKGDISGSESFEEECKCSTWVAQKQNEKTGKNPLHQTDGSFSWGRMQAGVRKSDFILQTSIAGLAKDPIPKWKISWKLKTKSQSPVTVKVFQVEAALRDAEQYLENRERFWTEWD